MRFGARESFAISDESTERAHKYREGKSTDLKSFSLRYAMQRIHLTAPPSHQPRRVQMHHLIIQRFCETKRALNYTAQNTNGFLHGALAVRGTRNRLSQLKCSPIGIAGPLKRKPNERWWEGAEKKQQNQFHQFQCGQQLLCLLNVGHRLPISSPPLSHFVVFALCLFVASASGFSTTRAIDKNLKCQTTNKSIVWHLDRARADHFRPKECFNRSRYTSWKLPSAA